MSTRSHSGRGAPDRYGNSVPPAVNRELVQAPEPTPAYLQYSASKVV
jgi:hypothetical protein